MTNSKDWRKDPKGAYAHIFLNQKWGNSNNSGRKQGKNGNYVRPYNKTIKSKTGEIVNV